MKKRSLLWEVYALCYDALLELKPYEDLMKEIAEKVELKSEQTVLDIGCGTGNAVSFLKPKLTENVKIIGIDLSQEMLKKARKKFKNEKNIQFLKADIDNMPFKGKKFDTIILNNVLYLFKDKVELLKKAGKLLKSGGKIVASTPKPDYTPSFVLKNHGYPNDPDEKWQSKNFLTWIRYIIKTFRLDLISVVKFICVAICNKKLVSEAHNTSAEELKSAFEKSGFAVSHQGAAYADQNFLIVGRKIMDNNKSKTDNIIIKIAETEEEMEQIYKLRYKVYCEKLKVLNRSKYKNFQEKDKYDERAFHFIAVREGKVIGTTRLIKLPSWKRFPMEEECSLPDYINRCKTLEVSRVISISQDKRLSLKLLHVAFKWSKNNDYEWWIASTNPIFYQFLKKVGWKVIELGKIIKSKTYNEVSTIHLVLLLDYNNVNFF